VQRRDVIRAQKAVRDAVAAMADAGMDTYRIREVLETVETKLEYAAEDAPKPRRGARVTERAEPTPEERRRDLHRRQAAVARTSDAEQVAYERATRILGAAVERVIPDFRARYDNRTTRYALVGALNRLAGAVGDMVGAHDRAAHEEETHARAQFVHAASGRPTPPDRADPAAD
jgi:hypothetical protein